PAVRLHMPLTARAAVVSDPMTSAEYDSPSLGVTWLSPPSPTTWALVRMDPSSSRTTPVPWLLPPDPAIWIATALGATRSATALQSTSSGASAAGLASVVAGA